MPTPLSDTAAGGLQRVFAYARVSTVEQLTENQREQIARAGYDIAPKGHAGKPIKIWVITEWDRSVTTVLRPEDY